MLEAGIQHFLDAMKLSAPKVAHLVETVLNRIEATVYVRESRIHMDPQVTESRIIDEYAHQNGEHGRRGGQGDRHELRVAHLDSIISR